LVVVGASAGGLVALTALLAAIDPAFALPILIVQHLAPDHPSMLVHLLQQNSALPVHQAVDGDAPLPGHVYVAPPDHHLVVAEGRLRLTHEDPVRFSRPSVDVLFESVAKSYDGSVIGVVLSGSGSDGTGGARAIRAKGGRIVVQDEESATNYGMPGAVVAAGAADEILCIPDMVTYLERKSREP
jgi:chemotaxis response regulator CheB